MLRFKYLYLIAAFAFSASVSAQVGEHRNDYVPGPPGGVQGYAVSGHEPG